MHVSNTNNQNRRHLFARVVLALVVVLAALAGPAAAPAAAHVSLIDSVPAYNATLPSSPGQLVLTFGSNVEAALVRATLFDSTDTEITEPEPVNPPGPATAIAFELPELADGAYKIRWMVYAYDGHVMEGILPFTIGEPPAAEPDAPADPTSTTVPTSGTDGPETGAAGTSPQGESVAASSRLLPIIGMQLRFLTYVALAAGVGALFWLAVRVDSDEHRPTVRRHATMLLRPAVALIAMLAAARGGVALWSALSSAPFERRAVTAIASGASVWAWALVVVLALLTWQALGGQAAERTVSGVDHYPAGEPPVERLGAAWWAAAALLGAVMFLSASVSHAVNGPIPYVSMMFGAVHLAAASLWFGPLLVFGLLRYRPEWRAAKLTSRSKALVGPLRAFGVIAWWSAVALTISGVRSAVAYSNGEFPSGNYLTLLIIKVGVALAVIIPSGAYHFWNMTRRTAPRPARFLGTIFERSSVVEIGGFLVVLAFAAVLSATSPI